MLEINDIFLAESMEELEGLASQVKEMKEENSRRAEGLVVALAKQARKLQPYRGITTIAGVLGLSRTYLYHRIETEDRYGDLLKDFPRLSRGHLAMLYGYGVTAEQAPHFLELADNESKPMSVAKLAREVKKELGLPDKMHACNEILPDGTICGKVHTIGGQHND